MIGGGIAGAALGGGAVAGGAAYGAVMANLAVGSTLAGPAAPFIFGASVIGLGIGVLFGKLFS